MTDVRLVVNADDFGMCAGVNAAIEDAIGAGSVTATSLMVGLDGWDDAMRRRSALAERADIGLHLNLLVGPPISGHRGLADARTGAFPGLAGWMWRAVHGAIDEEAVEAECEAQVRVAQAAGFRLTHIDSHRHVHLLPVVGRAVRRVAATAGIPFVRSPKTPLVWHRGFRTLARSAVLAAAARVPAAGPRIRSTDHFRGFEAQGSVEPGRVLLGVIDRLPAGLAELMVHPGRIDASFPSWDDYRAPREAEWRALTSPPLLTRLRAHGGLTRFSRV